MEGPVDESSVWESAGMPVVCSSTAASRKHTSAYASMRQHTSAYIPVACSSTVASAAFLSIYTNAYLLHCILKYALLALCCTSDQYTEVSEGGTPLSQKSDTV